MGRGEWREMKKIREGKDEQRVRQRGKERAFPLSFSFLSSLLPLPLFVLSLSYALFLYHFPLITISF